MKSIIKTKNAPAAIGPYNQATEKNGMVFTAGQICIDPATGELVQGTIEEETHQCLKNLTAILSEAGCTLDDVMSVSVYVTDMHDYARINAIYAEYFQAENAPARALVEVRNLPKFVRVEIAAIAIKSN